MLVCRPAFKAGGPREQRGWWVRFPCTPANSSALHLSSLPRPRPLAFGSVPVRFGEFLLREYEPGDEVEILASFNKIFAAVDPTFRPRTMAFWRWQFLGNPSGSRIILAFTDDGKVAGQFGAVTQRVLIDGRPALFSQGVDHMVDAAYRKGLRRDSLLAVLGNTIARLHGGPLPHQDSVMWGAPVPAAWRVGKTFVRYEAIRTQLKLQAAPEELLPGAAGGAEVEEVQAFPAEVGRLFERVRVDGRRRAIAVRDRPQLDWRFCSHPEKSYSIALARRGGELLGYAVFTRGDFDGAKDEGLVCDWLVAPGEERAQHALLAWLAARARTAGLERLTAIFPDTVPEWLWFQRQGFRARPTRYFIIGRQYARGIDMTWLHRNWTYTLGDTDLV